MKVLVSERIAEDGIALLKKDFDVDVRIGLSHEQLCDIIAEYDAIIVRSATQVNRELLERAANLKVAGRAGNGVDNIDVSAATQKGVIVVNTPDGNSMAAAELTIGLAFSIFRSIPQVHHAAQNKDFRRSKFKGFELNEKVAGIIGLGRIGGLVAERLKGMKMEVIAYDPYVSEERCNVLGVTKCETLDELLSKADLITVHMAKTEDTTNMIDAPQFKLMKKGVRIVNCARGGIINEKALFDAIVDGTVAAAGLDVFEEEPNFELKPSDQTFVNPLLSLDQVVYTPHLGASTQEAQYNVGVMVAKSVAAVLKGEMVAAVNMPGLKSKDLEEIRPYIDLAEKMGAIYFQAEKEPINKVEAVYCGELADKNTKMITLAFLKGLLNVVTEEKVNLVNAGPLARERGIQVSESTSHVSGKFTNMVTFKLHRKDKVLTLGGTVFGRDYIRIVDFFGYNMEFDPTPFVLAIQNSDKPGMVGKIGTILGSAGINIASMQLSRNTKGEKAVSFVSVDALVPKNVLEEIRAVEGILKATLIKF